MDGTPLGTDAITASFPTAIQSLSTQLEGARQKETELEAWTLFAASQLLYSNRPKASPFVVEANEGPVADAWRALALVVAEKGSDPTSAISQERTLADVSPPLLHLEKESSVVRVSVAGGQHAAAVQTLCLDRTLHRMADLAQALHHQRTDATLQHHTTMAHLANALPTATAEPWMQVLYEKLQQLVQYHTEHPALPPAEEDGYDLAGTIRHWTVSSRLLDTLYTAEEVMGKYLDLNHLYERFLHDCAHLLQNTTTTTTSNTHTTNSNGKRPLATTSTSTSSPPPYTYIDFLRHLSKPGGGLALWPEGEKLHYRKKYMRFLAQLQQYLASFLRRTVPLLHVDHLMDAATQAFAEQWSKTGGAPPGWSNKATEAHLAATILSSTTTTTVATDLSIDLSRYETAQALAAQVDGDLLKAELARYGLKCGGTVADRAARLFLLKHQSLDELPAKLFAIKPQPTSHDDHDDAVQHKPLERRIDIAHHEAIVSEILGQLGPTVEATLRRAERRQTQTLLEREREVQDELYSSSGAVVAPPDADDSGDEDAPIYNPKNVPLDFDGKPIPYWLFKLHGLNHYYPCEICGGESYRGRRNFELHFGETRHAAGMRSLGIPNTKHFHGVTKIDDAQELWSRLQQKFGSLGQGGWNEEEEKEEYEDSQGNVLSRTAYEDLARQNLL